MLHGFLGGLKPLFFLDRVGLIEVVVSLGEVDYALH